MFLTEGEDQMLSDLAASSEQTSGAPTPRSEVFRRLLRDAYCSIHGRVLTQRKEMRDPTHGPHVHVAYEGNEGNPTRLRIADGKAVGPVTIKKQDLREAREWLRNNNELALAEWRRLNPNDREA